MNIPEFIEHLYITYYQKLYNYLMSCFHDTDIAEEVTQDTFLKALIYAPHLKAHPNIIGWLKLTARNAGTKICYKRKHLAHLVDECYFASAGVFEFSDKFNIYDTIMSDDTYKIIRMKYIYGYSIKEIAQYYQISQSACKMRLNRVRHIFRAAI